MFLKQNTERNNKRTRYSVDYRKGEEIRIGGIVGKI